MSDLSRRNLFILGGTAAALAACNGATVGGAGNAPEGNGNYGDNPDGPGPGKLVSELYSLVILRFNAANQLESSYGSFKADSADDEAKVRAQLLKQLEGLSAGGDVQSLNPIGKDKGMPYCGYDFEQWGFGGVRRVYVYVDNKSVKFDKKAPLTFKAHSSYRSTDPARAESRKINPNKSFYGAKADEKFANGSLLYFENYYRDGQGNPIPPESKDTAYFSMSFNLLMETGKGGLPIPVSIDPDGGNGVALPPPPIPK